MLLGVATVMLVMAAGVAVAVNKQCNDIPCRGTDKNDELHERVGNHKKDRILGLEGDDLLDANNYRKDRDRLEGGRNGDRLLTNDNDGRDAARGGRGHDVCIIDERDAASSCSVRTEVAAGVNPAGFETD
jgi:hypothetical protein